MRINRDIGKEEEYKQECVCNYLNNMSDKTLLIYAEEKLGVCGWSVEYCRLALKYNYKLIYPEIKDIYKE